MVNRDITPLIVPPIKLLYFKDEVNQFQLVTDEINTQWYENWVLTEPRTKFDLIVDFFFSAFTIAENEKLTNYTFFENLTRSTDDLCFPFLMCEVKCDNEKLDYADRQNMHNCSVVVKALLKLEQKADQYRKDKQFESLLDKIFVYSISHDQKNARLYGHYALVEGEKWTYYRHHIANFDIVYNSRMKGGLILLLLWWLKGREVVSKRFFWWDFSQMWPFSRQNTKWLEKTFISLLMD